MKTNKGAGSISAIKKKLKVLTYPMAYLQMLFQTIMYKIYSK